MVVTQLLSKLNTIPDCHCVHVQSLIGEVARIQLGTGGLG